MEYFTLWVRHPGHLVQLSNGNVVGDLELKLYKQDICTDFCSSSISLPFETLVYEHLYLAPTCCSSQINILTLMPPQCNEQPLGDAKFVNQFHAWCRWYLEETDHCRNYRCPYGEENKRLNANKEIKKYTKNQIANAKYCSILSAKSFFGSTDHFSPINTQDE